MRAVLDAIDSADRVTLPRPRPGDFRDSRRIEHRLVDGRSLTVESSCYRMDECFDPQHRFVVVGHVDAI